MNRRTLLTSAASLPAVAVGTVPALASPTADPVFAARAVWQEAERAYSAAAEAGTDDAPTLDKAAMALWRQYIDTPATTPAGIAQRLRDSDYDGYPLEEITASIADLDRMAGQDTPEQPAQATRPDPALTARDAWQAAFTAYSAAHAAAVRAGAIRFTSIPTPTGSTRIATSAPEIERAVDSEPTAAASSEDRTAARDAMNTRAIDCTHAFRAYCDTRATTRAGIVAKLRDAMIEDGAGDLVASALADVEALGTWTGQGTTRPDTETPVARLHVSALALADKVNAGKGPDECPEVQALHDRLWEMEVLLARTPSRTMHDMALKIWRSRHYLFGSSAIEDALLAEAAWIVGPDATRDFAEMTNDRDRHRRYCMALEDAFGSDLQRVIALPQDERSATIRAAGIVY